MEVQLNGMVIRLAAEILLISNSLVVCVREHSPKKLGLNA